jgi:hypothetical protein
MSWATTQAAVATGTAKPMAWVRDIMAVLTPSTRPRESTSGPPLLPGLRGAVC